jgi:AcrR family transcriptional regulator/DNA-binding MarR family transcriptional regulator
MSGAQAGRRLTVVETVVAPDQPQGRRSGARVPQPELQRARLIASMTALSRERDWHGLSVDRICEHAAMSRRTFYEHFADAEDCFASAIEDALQRLWDEVADQVDAAGDDWAEQVAVAIVAFLAALELDRPRAWMAIMEPLYGNGRARAARQVVVDRFVALLERGPVDDEADRVPVNTAAGTIGGLWELALQHVSGGEDAVGLDEAAGSAIFLALSPFVGRHDAMRYAYGARKPSELVAEARERAGADEAPAADAEVTEAMLRLTELAAATLRHIAADPGCGNTDIAAALEVAHESQMSRLLRRLADEGLAESRRDGRSHAWRLTAFGAAVAGCLDAEQTR